MTSASVLVSPGRNVMLKFAPNDKRKFAAKIGDFGLATMCMGDQIDVEMFGTISHMPPELLMEGRLTFKSGVGSALRLLDLSDRNTCKRSSLCRRVAAAVSDQSEAVHFHVFSSTFAVVWMSRTDSCLKCAPVFHVNWKHRRLGVWRPHVGDVHRYKGIPGENFGQHNVHRYLEQGQD